MIEKTLLILGSTGSIGRQTLEIVAQHPKRLRVVGLAAGSNLEALQAQAQRWGVSRVALANRTAAQTLAAQSDLQVHAGPEGLCELVREVKADLVVAAISGDAGLPSVMAAVEAGCDVALANKEPLVAAGNLVTEAARRYAVELRPIDSEISAVWQCLRGEKHEDIEKILLTASGGPFSQWDSDRLATVTPEQALAHPTWEMGPKVTVDSATLMNKGFELFEMKWMFGLKLRQIEVVVHPQSTIHSAVQFRDGSCLAQMGRPDMRMPIQFALSYPERWDNDFPRLNLQELAQLTFAPPAVDRFPCLRLAGEAGEAGQSYPAVLSAADEVAVAAFLQNELSFLRISEVIERTLEAHEPFPLSSLGEVTRAAEGARNYAHKLVPE